MFMLGKGKRRRLMRLLWSVSLLVSMAVMHLMLAISVKAEERLSLNEPGLYEEFTEGINSLEGAADGWAGNTILFWTPIELYAGTGGWSNRDYFIMYYDGKRGSICYGRAISDRGVEAGQQTPVIEKVTSLIKMTEFSDLDALTSHDGEDGSFVEYKVGGRRYWSRGTNGKRDYETKRYRYDTIANLLEYLASEAGDGSILEMEKLLVLMGNDVKTMDTLDVNAVANGNEAVIFENTSSYQQGSGIYVSGGIDGVELSFRCKLDKKDISVKLPNFTAFLTSTEDIGHEATYLNKLKESFGGVQAEVLKKKQEQNAQEAVDEVAKAVAEFEKQSAYMKWATVIMNYVSTSQHDRDLSNAGTKLDEKTVAEYSLDNFMSWVSAHTDETGANKPGSLTSEEVLRLRVYAYLSCTKILMPIPFPGEWAALDDFDKGGLSEINIPGGSLNAGNVRNNADIVAKDTSAYPASTKTLSQNMEYLDYAVKYLAAKVYGHVEGNPFTNPDELDQDTVESNAFLKTIILDKEANINTVTLAYANAPSLPANLQMVAGTGNAYNAYAQIIYMLMLAETYVQYESGITEVTGSNGDTALKNEELELFIEQYKVNPSATEITGRIQSLIKTYTHIVQGFNYLGVRPFSEKMSKLFAYYNELIGVVEDSELSTEYSVSSDSEPLLVFFNTESKEFSYYYNKGVALSATYTPMQTNLYEVNSLQALDDATFVEGFHYPFGFYRKALYIDTDVNSAVNRYVTGKKGALRIATMNDLLACEKDIVLYIDDNFYNVDELAEMQGFSYSNLSNTEDADKLKTSLADIWSDWRETSIEHIAKTGSESAYSTNIRKRVSEYNSGNDKGSNYILSDRQIQKYLTVESNSFDDEVFNEYTPVQPFAVVSAIYRKGSLFSAVSSYAKVQPPVFVSSPNLAGMEGVSRTEWNTIYNYIMLKNLKGNMGVDYKTTLDLDSPIYMDVYGNILTESGLVIIPAASNATLQQASAYTVYTAGYLSLAENGYELPLDYNNSDVFMGGIDEATGTANGMFDKNEETGTWRVRAKRVNGYYFNFRNLPVADVDVLKTLMLLHEKSLASNSNMVYGARVYLITEVMRGAPIENIDKQREGLTATKGIGKYGIFMAYKLEELTDAMASSSNGNSLLTFPNLAFMDNYEVIIMFLYKIGFAALVGLMFVKVYMDVVQRSFGLKAIGKFISTLVLLIAVLYAVPNVINFSYYSANKHLLQDEASYIATLNLEKRNEGREIGVTEVTEPRSKTEMYIKLDSIDVPWYDAVADILSVNTLRTMDEIYDEAMAGSLLSELPGVEKKGDGLYMDVYSVFDTTSIEYDNENRALCNITTSDPYASFVTPYYAILDTIVYRVNEYNKENGTLAFSTSVQGRGAVRTKGLVKAYLESPYFMQDSQDATGLKAVYGLDTLLYESSVFSESSIERMSRSYWYSEEADDAIQKKLDRLDAYARQYVAKNRTLIGKVSDEAFIKVMALCIAMEHNRIFKVDAASSIEVFNIDTSDIIRLSLTDRPTALNGSSKSFARFVYDEGGTFGVVFTCMLVLVYFATSVVKPAFTLAVVISLFGVLVIRRLFRRDEDQVVEGFLISLALLCGINVVYALSLKLTMFLTNLNLSVMLLALAQIAIQVLYIAAMACFVKVVASDWKSLGLDVYQHKVHNLLVNKVSLSRLADFPAVRMLPDSLADEYKMNRRMSYYNSKRRTKGYKGSQILSMMHERDEARRSK